MPLALLYIVYSQQQKVMAALQVPSTRHIPRPLPTTPGSQSRPFNNSSQETEEHKKKMQTTVALREKNPHHFKIQPLKNIPADQRPLGSPTFNFERPFVGSRLEPPAMYQLTSNHFTSATSFGSTSDISFSVPSVIYVENFH